LDLGTLLEGNSIDDAYNLSRQHLHFERERPLTDPAKIPAAAIPARARPMIKAVELGAAPQMTEPTSNRRMLPSITVFTG
jgi:hypothetical protein